MHYVRTAALIAFALVSAISTASAQTPPPLAAFATTWAAVTGYRTNINCYSVMGSQSDISSYAYAFTKPSSITMSILSGRSAGNTVTWGGGNTVVAGRGMFKKSFSLTDPMVTSIRGATVVDLSFGSILQHAQTVAGTKIAASTTLNGEPVSALAIDVANPSSDNGLSREVLYLSSASNLPTRVDGYAGSQLASSCTFTNTVKT